MNPKADAHSAWLCTVGRAWANCPMPDSRSGHRTTADIAVPFRYQLTRADVLMTTESLADDWLSGQVAIWQRGDLTHPRSPTYTSRCVRSIVSMSPNGRVTLPASTRRALGLEGESFFEVHQQGSAIGLMHVALVPLGRARSRSAKKRSN